MRLTVAFAALLSGCSLAAGFGNFEVVDGGEKSEDAGPVPDAAESGDAGPRADASPEDAAVPDADVPDAGADRPAIVSVAAGDNTTFAVTAEGDVFFWGGNIGDVFVVGDDEIRAPVRLDGITGAERVRAGDSHACVLSDGDRLSCWGRNNSGRLGDGTEVSSLTPRLVALNGVLDVALGADSTCAITSPDRQLYCWGDNRGDVLGLGEAASFEILSPTAVEGMTQVDEVSVGDDHTCALRASGEIWCAGDGSQGRLGQGDTVDSPVFLRVPGFSNFIDVAVSDGSSCGVVSLGRALCWGSRPLGEGRSTSQLTPLEIEGLEDGATVESGPGSRVLCAQTTAASVACWGRNADAVTPQLGQGDGVYFTASALPVAGVEGIEELAVGDRHVCARTSTGQVWCWGGNRFGQVGIGSTESTVGPPVRVF